MKIVHENGKITYYYYKKKRGRKKKRGPKKKVEVREKKPTRVPYEFATIRCVNNTQKGYAHKLKNLEKVTEFLNKIEEHNKNVLVPMKTANIKNNRKSSKEYKCEYLILRLKKDSNEKSLLRNEYGRFVENVSNSDKWTIYDKKEYLIEEVFWVYGLDSTSERKDIRWIMDNMISPYIETPFERIRVICYNNKIVFKHDDGSIDFFICKTVNDSIKAYNVINKKFEKSKNVLFYGLPKNKSILQMQTIDDIRKKTGWADEKIYKKSTLL